MKSTESAGGVVVNAKQQVLIVSQRGKTWSLPKGHVELGETRLAAAKREIFEETGVTDLTYVKDLGHYSRHKLNKRGGDDIKEYKTIYLFLFHSAQTRLQPQDPKHPEARWVAVDQVVTFLSHEKDKHYFLDIQKEIEWPQPPSSL